MRTPDVELSLHDIRAVTRFATARASTAIEVFRHSEPDDGRPDAAHAALARPDGPEASVDELIGLANDHLRSVLARHPRTRSGTTPAGRLVHHLDGRLRA